MAAAPLAPPVVAGLLRAAATTIRAEMAALPADALAWHPAPGEWCVKDVLGHLIETEKRGFAGRIRVILAGDGPPLEGWDQEAVARARGDCAREWADLFDEFARLRDESVSLVAGLHPADLARGGQHPKVGFLTVGDLLHEWVHHDRNHIRQMLANVQGLAWPHMGNAQRFSLPAPS
ncbi:MAG TPA: DinB family protein [Methylomirabilota bacterium]|nr:DinB family protein [Methylomirabilota bacterium]